MAIHSSLLAWRMSWAEEPGRLQSMGSQRVGVTFTSLYFSKRFSKAVQKGSFRYKMYLQTYLSKTEKRMTREGD